MGSGVASPQAERRQVRSSPPAPHGADGGLTDTVQEEAGLPRYLDTQNPVVTQPVDSSRAHAARSAAPAAASSDPLATAMEEGGRQMQTLAEATRPKPATVDSRRGATAPSADPGHTPAESATQTPTQLEDRSTPEATGQAAERRAGGGGEGGEDAGGTSDGSAEGAPGGASAAAGGAGNGAGGAGGGTGRGAGGGPGRGAGGHAGGGSASAMTTPGGETATGQDAGTPDGAAPSLDDLGLGDLSLIDTELAEHQRWGAAAAHVGAAGSEQRAAFVLEQAGSGFLTGAGSGLGTALAIGVGTRLASKAVPVLGPILGAGVALHGLITGWDATAESVSKFGEGNDTYEVLANSIDAISQIINVVTGVLNIINSVVSVVEIAAGVVAAGGAVATVLTLGAAAPVVGIALEVVATCQDISEGLTIVTEVLDEVNQLILQPSVTLFRALHSFTSQADPRDVETQGQALSAAAAQSGGSLGGMIGGKLAHVGGGNRPAAKEEEPPPRHETPPAPSEPPAVHFDEPPTAARPGGGESGGAGSAQPHGEAARIVPPGQSPATPHADTVPPSGPPATLRSPGVEPPPPQSSLPPELRPTVPAEAPGGPAPEPRQAPVLPPEVEPGHPGTPTQPPGRPAIPPPPNPGAPEPQIPGPPGVPRIEPPNPAWGPEPVVTPDVFEPTVRPPAVEETPRQAASTPPAPRRITEDQTPPPESVAPAAPEPAKQYGPIDERSFADLQADVDALSNSPLGEHIAAQTMAPMQDVPRDTTRSKQAVHDAAYDDIRNNRPAGHGAEGIEDQHWMKVKDATIKASAGTDPATVEAINANRSPLNARTEGESTLLLTTQGVPDSELPGGNRGTRFFMGDEPMGRPAQPASPTNEAIPAEPGAVGGPRLPAGAKQNRAEHKFADARLIPAEAEKIQAARARAGLPPLDDVQLARAAGEQARYRMEGVPSTDLAQNPTKPWSGEVISRPTEPMQLELQPKDPLARRDWRRAMRQRAPESPSAVEPAAMPAATTPTQQEAFHFAQPAATATTAVGPEPSTTSPRPDVESSTPRPVAAGDETRAQATRSERPLTDEEFAAYRDRLIAKGVPPEKITRGDFTAFYPDGKGGGHVTIGPDVNPLPEAQRPTNLANPANADIDVESALSHESIGHREAELAGQARADPHLEEAQASVRASLLDPDLTPEQRRTLLADSAAHLRGRDNSETVYMWTERYEKPRERRAPRMPNQLRPQDQLPSVIVDREALGMESPPAAPRPAEPGPHPRVPTSVQRPERGASPPAPAPQAPSASISTAAGRVAAMTPAAPNSSASPDAGPQTPTLGTRLRQAGELFRPHVFGIGDPAAPKPEEVEAQQRAQFTADNQPAKGVERVNPDYPPPPGTPQQVEAMQQEISRLLAARAQAEAEAEHQDGRGQQCVANEGSIQQTINDTTHGITAAQAHQQSVAAHDAANQTQQQRQQESQSLVAGYPSKATGLAVLSVPLAAWQGFTSLASHLPGDAGTKMLQMNEDANKMQSAFVDMGAQMLGIDGQQPARQSELHRDAGRLDATATQAQGSQTDLHTAQAGAQGVQQANNAAKSEAFILRDNATQRGQQLGDQANKKQEQAKTLSEQMKAWAVAHKAARQQAIEATKQRLLAQGKVNVRTGEHG